jgi:hypothetical protein
VDSDPLYLYTQNSASQVITEYLETIWGTLLSYLAEVYSVPQPIRGRLCAMDLPQDLLSVPRYITVQWDISDFSQGSTPEYRYLSTFCGPQMRKGSISTLTISLPRDPKDPWWDDPIGRLGVDKPHRKTCDEVKFQVSRWGRDRRRSDHNAIRRAQNIIDAITNEINPPQYSPPSLVSGTVLSTSCDALKLGRRLYEISIRSPPSEDDFSSLQIEFPTLSPLIDYYKVPPFRC